jgi:hypothetical protein
VGEWVAVARVAATLFAGFLATRFRAVPIGGKYTRVAD